MHLTHNHNRSHNNKLIVRLLIRSRAGKLGPDFQKILSQTYDKILVKITLRHLSHICDMT